jgi:hypothetical protein
MRFTDSKWGQAYTFYKSLSNQEDVLIYYMNEL